MFNLTLLWITNWIFNNRYYLWNGSWQNVKLNDKMLNEIWHVGIISSLYKQLLSTYCILCIMLDDGNANIN